MRPATFESSVNHSGRGVRSPTVREGTRQKTLACINNPSTELALPDGRASDTLDTGSQIAIMPGLDQDIPLE